MESSKNQLLSSDTLKVLESFLDGNSYTITKDRPREIMDLLPKLTNLDIVRKTDRFKYGVNPSGRQQLKKLIELKSWKDFLKWIDDGDSDLEITVQSSETSKAYSKRYILFIKTQTDLYNVVSIDIGTLKYVIERYLNNENDFSIGGTKYFLRGLLEFKIYEFNSEGAIDRFLKFVELKKLKSKSIFDESYIGKDTLSKIGKDVSGIFLDAEMTEESKNNITAKKKMIDIFISHSSKDKEKVQLLINILRSALNLRQEQIRCTSVAGYKLSGGKSTDETLKQEIVDCKIFLGVLTEISITSTYVLFELGARWGLNKPMIPIVCEPSMQNVVKGPLVGLHCLNGSETTEIIQLVKDCSDTLKIKANSSDVYLEEAEKLAELSKKKVIAEISKVEVAHDKQIKSISNSNINISGIEKAVLSYAKNKYPDDYDMQEFELNKQMDAFNKLQNPSKEWSVLPEYNSISRKAARIYPNEFDMQLYEIEKQVNALLRLRGKSD